MQTPGWSVKCWTGLALLLWAGGAGLAAESEQGRREAGAAAGAAVGTLIPRKVLFGNPDKASPQISPDGKRLAFLAPHDGVLNIWVGPADKLAEAKPITQDKKRGIRNFFWAYTNAHIVYLQDKDGDENWRVYSVDLAAGKTLDLTPYPETQGRIVHVTPRRPDELLVAVNNRQPELHDAHVVNLASGASRLVAENSPELGLLDFTADDDLNVRLAQRMTPDGGMEVLNSSDGKKWQTFLKVAQEDSLTTGPIGFDRAGTTVYFVDSRDRNTSACVAIDMKGGAPRVLAADERADLADTIVHPTENTIQAVAFNYERKNWQILDQSIKADFDYLRGVADGDFDIVSRTLDDRTWIVVFELDNGPVRYYRYDRDAKKAHFLFSNRSELEKYTLAKMHPVVLDARDGRKLVSYLTLPVEAAADKPRPGKPLPMVLVVHGGPWARDEWGFDSIHQWLANRGYAVLSVNFRGSTGFGKKFINDGDTQWGGAMHNDLLDAVTWAVKERIADKDKIGILGGSYGGYAVLWALTNSPDTFACGVDIVGPSNLVTLINSIPPYWKPMLDLFAKRVGDVRTEEGRKFLESRSPLTYVENIRKPLLIGQGMNDPRVKEAESIQIVNAMKARNIPVTYVLYPDEGHGFARPENSISFWAVTEMFLAPHLGGKLDGIGPADYTGASMLVQYGANEIPDLQDSIPIRD